MHYRAFLAMTFKIFFFINNIFNPVEEPGVYAGEAVNFFDGDTLADGFGKGKHAFGCRGFDQFVDMVFFGE